MSGFLERVSYPIGALTVAIVLVAAGGAAAAVSTSSKDVPSAPGTAVRNDGQAEAVEAGRAQARRDEQARTQQGQFEGAYQDEQHRITCEYANELTRSEPGKVTDWQWSQPPAEWDGVQNRLFRFSVPTSGSTGTAGSACWSPTALRLLRDPMVTCGVPANGGSSRTRVEPVGP